MSSFELFTILILLLAVVSIINEKFMHMPFAIGITIASVIMSILCIWLEEIGIIVIEHSSINFLRYDFFSDFLLKYVLGFLLFAGSLHVKIDELKKEGLLIFILSTISVVLFTVIYGSVAYLLLNSVGIKIDLLMGFVIGVIISPTDPISVMSILNACYVPKKMRILISGESLFNDGISFSLFIILASLKFGHLSLSFGSISSIIFKEIFLSILFGITIGYFSFYFIKKTTDPIIAVLTSISCIAICFTLADKLHFSGPLAIVAVGLIYGKHLKNALFIKNGDESYYNFWSVLDKLINGILFLIMGLELSTLEFTKQVMFLSLAAIVMNVSIRFISVIFSTFIYHARRKLISSKFKLSLLLTWGGLRGSLSLALVMSLGNFNDSKVIISMIYFVIIFSIIVQGLTLKGLLEKHNFASINDV